MNEALQRWREDFAREPDTAFDRLVRGVVPLGGASQLSFGEILDALFEPGDASLDTAAAGWLEKRILGPVPENASLHRWVSVLEEYFRGIAAMELPQTGEILRRQHKRIRLWLYGFYEGPDRDPEGAYLIALARAQDDPHFSPLWRRLILGEELAGRPYLGIGILGFRKMPGQDGRESSGVPEGLLQALVELADKPGTGQAKWKQTMLGMFAAYRRSSNYWVEHIAPLLPYYQLRSNARESLSIILPGIISWRPPVSESGVPLRTVSKVPRHVVQDWIHRIRDDVSLCDRSDFFTFLDQLRAYAKGTGNPEYINKTLNNISTTIVEVDRTRAALAVSFMEEALWWAPWDPRNWTSYAIVLCAAHREGDAIQALWEARQRFPWNSFIRNELGRILRNYGDLAASEGVLREAVGHFPSNVVSQSSLAETLRAMGRPEEACAIYRQICRDFPNQVSYRIALAETLRSMGKFDDALEVYEQGCRDFPDDVILRGALADRLIDLGQIGQAESMFREVLKISAHNPAARGGLARALSIRGARTRDEGLRAEAKHILEELAKEGDNDAMIRLEVFDDQWERATIDFTITFRREAGDRPPQLRRAQQSRALAEMSVAERLGRAMITLWQAERTEDATLRSSLCARATTLLEVPEGQIDDDLIAAFVETRGLVLLASGEAQRALDYFEEQIRHYGRGGWIGIQLGDQRARIALGITRVPDETVEAPSSQSAHFALHVARVIEILSTSSQESNVRDLLKILYPRAANLAARAQPDAEGGLSIESGAEMLGAFLQTRWFRPAGIQSPEDFDNPEALHTVIERINNTRTDTFNVISNATLALAA